ncbi:DUF2268 domain-containing putative Zn-dependent protease [Halobacillus rhizosphaerae]|uniref:DUF2268 domain-containing protein n=1 Tax=Halobacillus rhizosphaerae TaxID=3064889 RepID=UPI00398A9FEE
MLIPTQDMIRTYVEKSKRAPRSQWYFIQCDVVAKPLKSLFPHVHREEIHYNLLEQGLFEPEERNHLLHTLNKMEELQLWRFVEREYKLLKRKWKGPDIPIYIFPIKKAQQATRKQAVKKNGLAYKEVIFLFLSPYVNKEEIKALLAHEYSHVCRLASGQTELQELTLSDSIIMEGIGEYAVKEQCGDEWLAPWTSLYSEEQALDCWNKEFLHQLSRKGLDHHQIYLYGNGTRRLPKWMGYHLGYRIIHAYMKRHPSLHTEDLLAASTEELLQGSGFPTE